ncbi:DsbA family protein [Candidatus Daviesbacteria bacterium]|nr:DsbA family protein [Candidatus Daviesbacteria bacterium]
MKTETKVLGIILIITIALLFGGIFLLSRNSSGSAEERVAQIDYTKGQKIGSDSAKVKLVEFSDFQCPACRAAEPVLQRIRSTYSDRIQLIYRHFPLYQHQNARRAAYLSEAAGQQGKFWEVHDKIFETQTQWSNLGNNEATVLFLDLAKQLGLDEDKVKQEISADTFKTLIDTDIAEGRRLGVNSTPTFFLNGRKLNLQNFNDLVTVIDEELKK